MTLRSWWRHHLYLLPTCPLPAHILTHFQKYFSSNVKIFCVPLLLVCAVTGCLAFCPPRHNAVAAQHKAMSHGVNDTENFMSALTQFLLFTYFYFIYTHCSCP